MSKKREAVRMKIQKINFFLIVDFSIEFMSSLYCSLGTILLIGKQTLHLKKNEHNYRTLPLKIFLIKKTQWSKNI